MGYRLRLDEGEVAGLTRIAREEVAAALAELRKGEAGVHEARKSIKKIRAILRLLRRPASEHDPLREMAHRLAASRDAAAMSETIESLRANYTGDAGLKALSTVGKDAPVEAPDLRATPLLRFRRGLAAWENSGEVSGSGFRVLERGLRATYRRGRKALRTARETGAADDFHRLRKRAKDHWYHIRLLRDLWPVPMDAREKCLKELQEWLGDDHNLAVLATRTASEPARELIGKAQAELRDKTLAVADKLYAERVRDHVRLLRKLWKLSAAA